MSKEKKWIISLALAVGLTTLFGTILLLIPNFIKVNNEFVGNFGCVVLVVSIISAIICLTAVFKLKKAARIGAIVGTLICISAAFLGYFAYWWFKT